MKLSQVNLYQLAMPLVTPFVTSYGVMKEKPFYLVEVVEENGQKGYGELEALQYLIIQKKRVRPLI